MGAELDSQSLVTPHLLAATASKLVTVNVELSKLGYDGFALEALDLSNRIGMTAEELKLRLDRQLAQ